MTTMQVQCKPCIFCGESATLEVPVEGLEAYKRGAFVQEAFPNMPAGDRELLISGTHDECWNKFIPEDDD